jgi:hypothetical protein
VDGGSALCPMAGFVICNVQPSSSATTALVIKWVKIRFLVCIYIEVPEHSSSTFYDKRRKAEHEHFRDMFLIVIVVSN